MANQLAHLVENFRNYEEKLMQNVKKMCCMQKKQLNCWVLIEKHWITFEFSNLKAFTLSKRILFSACKTLSLKNFLWRKRRFETSKMFHDVNKTENMSSCLKRVISLRTSVEKENRRRCRRFHLEHLSRYAQVFAVIFLKRAQMSVGYRRQICIYKIQSVASRTECLHSRALLLALVPTH